MKNAMGAAHGIFSIFIGSYGRWDGHPPWPGHPF